MLDIMTGVDRGVGRGVGRDLTCQGVDLYARTRTGLLGVLALSEEVVLGIDLRNGRKPNEALVGVGSLRSTAGY